MIDIIRDIRNAMEAEIADELGSDYSKLAYVSDVEKNSYRTNNNRYGVRALSFGEVDSVTKYVTQTQSFEVVLTKGYYESNLDDSEQIERALDNDANMLSIYKRLVNTKAGLPDTVLNIQNLQASEPEFLVEEKVAVQRATIDISYRYSLI